jgi:hypothetical protein
MIGKGRRVVAYILAIAAASSSATPARAQDAAAIAGTYCLAGVREVGSCLRLAADGKFDYFLAYGAYDEKSEGRWRFENGDVILDSPPYDRRAKFAFKQLRRGDRSSYVVLVENGAGRPLQGIDVRVTCDGRTAQDGYTQQTGYETDCAGAPTSVALGLHMFGLAYQSLDVTARAGDDKVYVFEFDPGDLGRKAFTGQRLKREGTDRLTMTYANSPIRELEGRRFGYVRN